MKQNTAKMFVEDSVDALVKRLEQQGKKVKIMDSG
jgi:hypothetical protein